MTKVIDAIGQQMNSSYLFGDEGRKKGLVLESWSGANDYNKDYASALETILERLQRCGIPRYLLLISIPDVTISRASRR